MASSCGSATSTSPCAACKFLRRKCLPECVFAPYFPPDQPQKFANVHKVFGASNVSKLLNDLQPQQREDAVNSLAYEADMRLRDPVYGCVGVISLLQHQLRQLQIDLTCAKTELSKYQNTITISGLAAAAAAAHHHHHFHHQFFPVNQPPHLLRSTTAPSTPPPFDNMGYDTAGALLSINAFLPSAAAGPPAEDRRTPVEPS